MIPKTKQVFFYHRNIAKSSNELTSVEKYTSDNHVTYFCFRYTCNIFIFYLILPVAEVWLDTFFVYHRKHREMGSIAAEIVALL